MAAKEVLPGPIELNLPYIRISLAIFSVALINYGLFFINKEPTESLKVVNAKTIESPYEQLQTIKPTPQVVPPSEINRVTSTESLNISPTPTIFNPPTAFEQWLNNPDYFLDYYPDYSLDSALITLLRHWGKEIPETGKVDCHSIVAMGLRCVYGKTTWRELLLIKRPVILEFSLNNSKKQHALVTGYRQKTAEIEFKENIKFPLADVLKYWEGYYLALEAPVMPTAKGILQGQSSDNVLWLRNVLNNIDGKSPIVQDPTYYDEALAQRVLKFQEQFHLKKDSRVEGDTLLRLKQFVHNFQSSHLKISD
jgi:general secretion pathway protein A